MISFSPLITLKPKTVPLTAMTELFEDRKNSSSSCSLFCTSASTIPSSTKTLVLYLSLPSDLILIFVFSPKYTYLSSSNLTTSTDFSFTVTLSPLYRFIPLKHGMLSSSSSRVALPSISTTLMDLAESKKPSSVFPLLPKVKTKISVTATITKAAMELPIIIQSFFLLILYVSF